MAYREIVLILTTIIFHILPLTDAKNRYKQELAVLEEGRRAIASPTYKFQRQGMLCVVFMNTDAMPVSILQANIVQSKCWCHWGIIFYAGVFEKEKEICKSIATLPVNCTIAFCHHFTQAPRSRKKVVIPKSVMYHDLLPYLTQYQHVMLLDQDISFVNFEFKPFMDIWQCSFRKQPAPLVVQPLIAEPTQDFSYVHLENWARFKAQGVLASATGFIEQQVPAFNTVFFEWFIRSVLIRTRKQIFEYGADWGMDRTWCNAAKAFSTDVLGWERGTIACAFIVGSNPVHHFNTKSMDTKRENLAHFRLVAGKSLRKYLEYFPTWVVTEPQMSTNPLDHKYGNYFMKVNGLDRECLEARQANTTSFGRG